MFCAALWTHAQLFISTACFTSALPRSCQHLCMKGEALLPPARKTQGHKQFSNSFGLCSWSLTKTLLYRNIKGKFFTCVFKRRVTLRQLHWKRGNRMRNWVLLVCSWIPWGWGQCCHHHNAHWHIWDQTSNNFQHSKSIITEDNQWLIMISERHCRWIPELLKGIRSYWSSHWKVQQWAKACNSPTCNISEIFSNNQHAPKAVQHVWVPPNDDWWDRLSCFKWEQSYPQRSHAFKTIRSQEQQIRLLTLSFLII